MATKEKAAQVAGTGTASNIHRVRNHSTILVSGWQAAINTKSRGGS